MKLTILLCTAVFIAIAKCPAQTTLDTDGKKSLNNVYLYALKEYCKSLDSSKTKIVYVRYDHFIGDSWPKKINGFDLRYLQDEYCETIKANGGSMTLVGISSSELVEGELYVTVIPFAASCNNKTLQLTNGGGMTAYFTYDPLLKGLVFESKEWSGI